RGGGCLPTGRRADGMAGAPGGGDRELAGGAGVVRGPRRGRRGAAIWSGPVVALRTIARLPCRGAPAIGEAAGTPRRNRGDCGACESALRSGTPGRLAE